MLTHKALQEVEFALDDITLVPRIFTTQFTTHLSESASSRVTLLFSRGQMPLDLEMKVLNLKYTVLDI